MSDHRGLFFAALSLLAAPAVASWAPLGSPIPPQIALQLAPSRPELLYARVTAPYESSYFLWGSTDAGATYGTISSPVSSSRRRRWRSIPRTLQRSGRGRWTASSGAAATPEPPGPWSPRARPPISRWSSCWSIRGTVARSTASRTTSRGRWCGPRAPDGGLSFTAGSPIPSPFDSFQPVHVHPLRDELLSFGGKGLTVSTDGGRSWHFRGRFHQTPFLSGDLAPSAPDILYAVPLDTNQCLVRSDDDGANWQALAYPRLPPSHSRCLSVAVDPGDARHVWVDAQTSCGDGRLPQLRLRIARRRLLLAPWLPVPSYHLVAGGGGRLFSGDGPEGTGLVISDDGGRTWKPRRPRLFSSAADLRTGLVAQRLPAGVPGRRIVAVDNSLDGFRFPLPSVMVPNRLRLSTAVLVTSDR